LSVWLDFSESWKGAYPGAAIGILAIRSASNLTPGPALKVSLRSLEVKLRDRYAGQSRRDLENLSTLRPYVEHYRRFGKTYHILLQLESVARRGRPLAGGDSLVSAMFAAELDNLLLTAGHDLEALRPPLVADVTHLGERYLGIGERELEVKPGDMSIRDTNAIISTVLYGPDHRTRLTPDTRSVVFTTYAPAPIPDSEINRHLREIEALVRADSPSAMTEVIGVLRPG
jgi:DNA/RNA-binding domain of Phe-tRNA-synthetase-like protein